MRFGNIFDIVSNLIDTKQLIN